MHAVRVLCVAYHVFLKHTYTTANRSKYLTPYDTEVRLVQGGTGYPSSGIVEIYLNHQWGTVCFDTMNIGNAETICRQMGYTGASHFNQINVTAV